MTFTTSYRNLAAKTFNDFVEPRLDQFKSVHHNLKMSNMGILFREYISVVFFTTMISPFVAFPVSLIIFLLVGWSAPAALIFSIIAAAGTAGGVFLFGLQYPTMIAAERKRDIDNNLPFASLYMNTIAGTGAPPDLIFKLLGDFKEYGEVSREAQEISKDIEVMGQDIETAMSRAAERSPSPNFKDLLWGMVTTIVRGGDLRSLLREQSEFLMEDYRRKLEQYTDDISLYVEVYITLVIVGSIFSIVMLTIMGAISGFESLKAIQQMLVFIFLPVSSIIFIVLLKLASPVST